MYLLDVNVLIALAWPNHIHHEICSSWFHRNSSSGWATCPLTQTAFVRISSNPGIIQDAVSVADAMDSLRKITKLPNHTFWHDSISLDDEVFTQLIFTGHRQITDAYLLSLAINNKGKLATLDTRISSLISLESGLKQHLEIIK